MHFLIQYPSWNDDEYQSLLRQSDQFTEKYKQLFEGEGFLCGKELRKTSKEAVRKRFDTMIILSMNLLSLLDNGK